MATIPAVKLVDPDGRVRAAKRNLNKEGAVRRSPFCEVIISLWLQGAGWRDIEQWLIAQGPDYRIPSTTLWRNFKKAGLDTRRSLTKIEEEIEANGGVVFIDIVNEARNNLLLQKRRIDHLVRTEAFRKTQKGSEFYHDKRVAQELKAQAELIALYSKILDQASGKGEDSKKEGEGQPLKMTSEAKVLLVEMLISGEIELGDAKPTLPGE